ncbi:MAG: hypothetical protein NTX25_18050 [Proteobacteria bacterium]|nr:hypothetical protein [Pseudomonadota bacterium]
MNKRFKFYLSAQGQQGFYACCFFIGMAITCFLALGGPAEAYEYDGDARLGYLTRQVEFKGDFLNQTNGETHNDEQVLNAQLKLNIEDLSSNKDRVLFDFRDKRDNFGKLERENLRLINYDRRQLRLLAFERPWESNRHFFSLGRFALPEANILANDGAEYGYRSSKALRYGIFAGQAPKNIISPLYVDPETRSLSGVQAGAYLNFEHKEGFEDSTYFSSAIAEAPTYDVTDAENHAYYYQKGMWTVGGFHRYSSLIHYDFTPKSSLRRAYLSYAFQAEKLRAGGSFQQTNTEDYLIKQVIQDTLAPSAVQSFNLDLRYLISNHLSIDLASSEGRRTSDGLKRTENALGLLFPRLLGDSSSVRLQLGVRANFQSHDKFSKISYDFYARSFSIGLSYMIVDENYDDGTTNKRTIANLDGGFFLFDDIRGSVGYELENDSKVNASALLMMLGYRFGAGSLSAPRTKPARFEEI